MNTDNAIIEKTNAIEEYIYTQRVKNKDFVKRQLAMDGIATATGIFFIIQSLDSKMLYFVIAVMIIALNVTAVLNINASFGSFNNLAQANKIANEYHCAKNKFEKLQKKQAKGKITLAELDNAEQKYRNTIEAIFELIPKKEA